ncbi:MAG: TonB-dependent receptor [Bacteroidales bacterium]|jgi:iron complex outermembrane receptor protein|nr:TonB-dependent receptor [Bacteroidales bacterium]
MNHNLFKNPCTTLLPVVLILSIIFSFKVSAQNETVTVSGTVMDEARVPVPGVNVIIPGNNTGVSTDENGHYTINVPASIKTLRFFCLGYISHVAVIPASGKLDIILKTDVQMLNETVVIGYGTRRKEDLTGSVASLGDKQFNKSLAISSPEQLINGKVAGVQIMTSGGSPTSGSTIRIRGGASLNASNDPLIVVDGVPLEISGNVSGSSNFLSMFNPNDIENITVLRDASSTAIYGSRASNGVILITTKKGTGAGKFSVDFNTTNSIATPYKYADILSRQEFVDVVNSEGSDAQKALLGTASTDWNKEIFHKAFGTDNNLSVSGRFRPDFPFRFSMGAYKQNGVLKTDRAKRYTGGISLSPSFFKNTLRFTFNVKGSMNKNRFAETGAIWGGSTMNPTIPVYSSSLDFNGYTEAVDATGAPITKAVANPVGELKQYKSASTVYRVIGNADMDYYFPFVSGLKFHTTLGYDYSRGKGHVHVPDTAYEYYSTGGRDYDYGPQVNHNRLLTTYFNYVKNIEPIKSSIDVTAGYDYQYWKDTNAAYFEKNVAGDVQSSSAPTDERHVLISYYARVNYVYDSRYMLTLTARRDGTSRFSKNNRWGTFPSVAFAWNATQEKFLKDNNILSNLKFRLSYGVTGQQAGIGNYSYMPVYTISQDGAQYVFGGTPIYTLRPEAYVSDLKWETTDSYNAGVDFGFLDDRLGGSVDYYNRKTKNLLATVPTAAGTNFDKQILTNVGNVKSHGLEFSINAVPVKNRDLTISLNFNATKEVNKITNLSLVKGSKTVNTSVGPTIDAYYFQVLTEGYAPYSFYVHKQIYDKETGKPIEGLYADLNKDGKITSDDLYHYHSPAPDWILGFSASIDYKRWSLSTSMRANIGNYVYNGMAMNTGAWSTMSYNSYQLNNLNSSYLKTGFQSRQYLSDYYVQNASFLKMDNLTLSYNFDMKKICRISVSGMVQNVFTITNYDGVDPEVPNGMDSSFYPRPRTFSFAVGLRF